MSSTLELHYRESGNTNGETLVFLHGLFASLQNWQSIIKLLADEFHIINIDLPNHGSSPHSPKFTFEECVNSTLYLLDKLNLSSSHIIGHSLGGKIAMLIALQYPERIHKLIVEDIAPKAYPPWFAPIMRNMAELNLNQINSRKEADERLSQNIEDKDLRAFLLTNLKRSEDGFKWRVHLDALISGGPAISGFPQLELKNDLPALFIAGGTSPYIQPEDQNIITQFFPSAQIKVIDGADHWVHAREPQLFADMTKGFIKNP